MTRASKLYPSKIQAQCNEAIMLLEENTNCLQNVQNCISEFVNDTMIESIAFDQLKMQCENYIGVIDSITSINNSDISDYGKLSSEVGSEVLEGEIIITNQEKFMRLRDEAYENERVYRSKASGCWYAPLAVMYSAMAEMFRLLGDNYQEEYQIWIEKEMLYDNIEAATSGLFANSGAVRGALGSLLSELQGSFKLYFGYTPDTVALENMQLKYIEHGDIDIANGIKALNEYLIQTGNFTAAERNAIINNISECAPEKLRSLPHIISVAGTENGGKVMEGMIYSYLPEEVVEAIRSREILQERDRWVGVTDKVAQAYLDNVYTYCTRIPTDLGYGTADKRKNYLLNGIEGNLEGVMVGDDCSSFVYACLIQAGYIPEDKISQWAPSSGNYLPGGDMCKILEESGFVWHSNKDLEAVDILQGDILVKNGHVEIFDRYDEEGKEHAYTWGRIYTKEPAQKDTTMSYIWEIYEGVWRYEGK